MPRESTHKDFLLVRQEGKRNVQREYKLFKQKELANLKSDFDNFLELREKIASYKA